MRQLSPHLSSIFFCLRIISFLPHSLALLARLSSQPVCRRGVSFLHPYVEARFRPHNALSRVTSVLQYVCIIASSREAKLDFSRLLLICTRSTMSSLEIDRSTARSASDVTRLCFLARPPAVDGILINRSTKESQFASPNIFTF